MKRLLPLALALLGITLGARAAGALGTTSGTAAPGVVQHGPDIFKAPATDASGNEYWVLRWSICPQFVCAGNPAAGNGFRTIPSHFTGGNDVNHNAVAIGVTLPLGTTVLGMTIRDHGDVVWPMNNVASWLAAYPPVWVTPGMYFQPAFPHELSQIQSAAYQGPVAQAFEMWTSSLAGFNVSAGFFDVYALAMTGPGIVPHDIQWPYLPTGPDTGSIALYDVDLASPTQNISVVHLASDPLDPCTAGQAQMLKFDLRDCVLAAAAQPGTPGAGAGFDIKLRENFPYPPLSFPTPDETPVAVSLPAPVQPGWLVLLDGPRADKDSVADWSDVIYYSPISPAGPQQAVMFSDPAERPFSDADFSPYGFSIANVMTGNSAFVRETLPFTTYAALDTASGTVATYHIYSDVDTLPPGAPLIDVGATFRVVETAPEPAEPVVSVPLSMPVQPGFVVLLEDTLALQAPEDTTGWSDVVFFPSGDASAPGVVMMASDAEAPGGGSHGMSSADLAPLGVNVLDVLEGNTMYVLERGPTIYRARNPNLGDHTNTYYIVSDLNQTGVTPLTGTAELAIRSVAPNPARGATRVDFTIPRDGRARLEIFDLEGRQVRTLLDGALAAGPHSATWDGRRADGGALPAGAYFARLTAQGRSVTRRVVLLK